MARKKTPQTEFAVGDAVRVKSGLTDPDYPDMPIGGWAGRIAEAEPGDPPTYLVRWRQETLQNVHPVYRQRCERDGLDLHEMWLQEDDLEPDTGKPAAMEQPANIQTNPLDMQDQEDRIRALFGLTHDDLLPDVSLDSLRSYHRWLAEKLSFPFEAYWQPQPSPFGGMEMRVIVMGLRDAGEIDIAEGLTCDYSVDESSSCGLLAEMEVKHPRPERQWVEDYRYWFWNWL